MTQSEETAEVVSPPVGAVRMLRLLEFAGSKSEAARLLGVSRTQPGRWLSGQELPSPISERRLLDLDYVLARLEQAWDPSLATDWLESPNPFLDDSPPIDVLQREGPARVIAAIDAELAGSYA